MKNDESWATKVRSRPALAPSASTEHESGGELHQSSPLISDSRGHYRPRGRRGSSMQFTDRDHQIVELIFHTRALRDDQVQLALFTPGNASGCQRRLTLLVRHRYLDRLPRRSSIDPAVYLLGRRSVTGNQLMRNHWGEAEFRSRMGRLGSVAHLLAVNDVRVRVERACRNLGWSLLCWQQPEDLARMGMKPLIPDAYFQIQRVVEGQPKTAAFFLELERTSGSGQLRSKLLRYRDLYRSGQYEVSFGTKALRLLVVFASDSSARTRPLGPAIEAARLFDASFSRFAQLDQLKASSAADLLTAPLWLSPQEPKPVALFQVLRAAGSWRA